MTEVRRYAAFTSDPSGGNPAGVVLDADGLDESRMQEIAAEVGYSETAFVVRDDSEPGHFGIRYFSPEAEVAFCGHATIATGVALAEQGETGTLVFATRAGEVQVSTTRAQGTVRASLRSVPAHSRPVARPVLAEALAALGWPAEDLAAEFPPHVAFAGNDHLVLAAGSRHRLASLDYDFAALKALCERERWTTVQLFWAEDAATFHSRNPFPVGGVVEDPATGAAAAALGAYLTQIGRLRDRATFTVIQGEDMGRRSELTVTVDPADPRVAVAGTAVRIPKA